jgi:hypothetical protein
MKNLSNVKTFFQIFNCKLTYNDYTHYSLRTLIHCVQSQIWERQYPKNGGVRKANSVQTATTLHFWPTPWISILEMQGLSNYCV